MNKYIIFALLSLSANFLSAQEKAVQDISNPPIVVEMLFGNKGYMGQMTINKSFSSAPRFGFFSATNMSANWGESISEDMMNQIHLTYQFTKGFKVLVGSHYTPITGLRPNTAIMYTYTSKNFLISVMPRIDLSKNSNVEGFTLIEYKPHINANWNFYTRVQGLYCIATKNGNHSRSYLMLRAGLGYKEFLFGLGANFDAYGPEKATKSNYGIFISTNIFN